MIPLQIRDTNFLYHKIGGHDEIFQLSDMDSASPNYYGYLSASGYWIIIEETITASVTTYRYVGGTSATEYKTAVTGKWATRAALTYGYYDALFS